MLCSTTATLEAFEAAIDWASSGHISTQDVDEAKLALFQSIDAPSSPANRGTTLFLSKITDEQRQRR